MSELRYQSGFGNFFESEALSGALPREQNSPQKSPKGLYPEQLSGSSFTAPAGENLRTWQYKIQPSVVHGAFRPASLGGDGLRSAPMEGAFTASPNQMRWDPLPYPSVKTDFVDSLRTIAVAGSLPSQAGCAAHWYAATASMDSRYFSNADGEMLVVPQEGAVELRTELGILNVSATEIAVIPRGVKFQVVLPTGKARGYICENYGAPLRLPHLGPIGANGLANPRHFLAPVAAYEDHRGKCELVHKFQGNLWSAELTASPLNTVAWQGNYYPYKYDLKLFNTINTVSFDHPDPSIFTVLTSPSSAPGFANIDFVIFPPRWMVAEHSFRPPYFHRNFMSELMGLIHGEYDAKAEGFAPGGVSLHNSMSAHGPDATTFEKASAVELKPSKISDTLAFMFEGRYVFQPTPFALSTPLLQKSYQGCWSGLSSQFKG